MKKIWILFLCVCIFPFIGSAQERTDQFNLEKFQFGIWKKLLNYSLSEDGAWACWSVQYGVDNDTLYLYNVKEKNCCARYANTSNVFFSDDSQWLLFSESTCDSVPHNIAYQFRLTNLRNMESVILHEIESASFVNGGKCLLLNEPSDKNGKDLVLYTLSDRSFKPINKIQKSTLSSDARLMAYTTVNSNGQVLEVINLDSKKTIYSYYSKNKMDELKWHADNLLFLEKERTDSLSYTPVSICVVKQIEGAKPRIYRFSKDATLNFPEGKCVNPNYAFRFSPDHKHLELGLIAQTQVRKTADNSILDIWHWKDERVQPYQQHQYYSDVSKSDVCIWHIDEGKFIYIENSGDYSSTQLSPDFKYLLIEDDQPYRPHFRELYKDYYLHEMSSGERIKLLEHTRLSVDFSDRGKYLYYFDEKDWCLYDIAQKKFVNLTQGAGEFRDKSYDGPIDGYPSCGSIGWVGNDQDFYFYDKNDLWVVSMKNLKPQRITNGFENNVRYRLFEGDNFEKGVQLIGYKDDYSQGFYGFKRKGKPQKLVESASRTLRIDRSKSGNNCIFARERSVKGLNLYLTNSDFSNEKLLFETVIACDTMRFSPSKQICYSTQQGRSLKGTLHYPVNYDSTQRYPMIVIIYEKMSNLINKFVYPDPKDPYNRTNFNLNGYFVLEPDITYDVNHPGESSVDCVTSAVECALKEANIDKSRIALMGHSWGAYQSAYIISQTDLFRVAIAGAPLTNLITMYNSIYKENGKANQQMFETSQARFRQPWWEIQQEYMKNSPVFQASNIHTPLLMVFGDEDSQVDWNQGVEMYITMRRLQKPCIMLVYKGEGHSIGGADSTKDLTIRMMEYLDYYLKDGSPREWIDRGESYLQRHGIVM